MKIKTISYSLSDVGVKRDHNEDSLSAEDHHSLYVIADGMGGHLGGETASKLAIETITQYMQNSKEHPNQQERVESAIQHACAAIYNASRDNALLSGMGTTTSLLYIHRETAYIAHVGDSRIYLVRNDAIQQISDDHSLVNEQVKAGIITADEARNSVYKNIITRSVGFEESVKVDLIEFSVEYGDCFILCSDGLSNLVEEHELLEITKQCYLSDLPEKFVEIANSRGGDDNISVIISLITADDNQAFI